MQSCAIDQLEFLLSQKMFEQIYKTYYCLNSPFKFPDFLRLKKKRKKERNSKIIKWRCKGVDSSHTT